MSSQSVPSRKRPAPGTSPVVHQQIGSIPNYSNPGAQLSNDQFLQWGQDPAVTAVNPPPSFPADVNVNSFNPAQYATTGQDVSVAGASPSNQLTRRQPMNQLVSRNRGYEQPTAPPSLLDHNSSNDGWGESLAELEQRALIAKREAQAKRKQIPPFVQKLSSFLDESKNTDLIRWSDDGNSFIVLDEDEFARTLIPELFKHNNYASFVRQLNMYGFHKKVGLSDNSMRASERKNKSPSEYANPYFKRGHPDLLWLIQKPKNVSGQGSKSGKGKVKTEDGEDGEGDEYGEDGHRDDRARSRGQLTLSNQGFLPKEQLAGIYRELQTIRQQQQIISQTINKLRREHEQLYAQAASFQEQHARHENSINAILTFLATVYNRSLQGHEGQQNLTNPFSGIIQQDQGNVVDVDDFALSTLGGGEPSPGGQRAFKKQPLLLKAPPKPQPDAHGGRASTLSPSGSSTYDRSSHSRKNSHVRQPSVSQPGSIEEVHDTSPQQTGTQQQPASTQQLPQRDIMSVIQNSNARNGIPTTFSEFPNVLSSLETSGGNSALTPNQRADMLRLMANETSATDPNAIASSNNALVTPNPPPMPQNYSAQLASTREEIDNLVKMQAEQDRSVQNLTNLLQPLSPTGTIPGLNDANVPPPSLDLDQIFNSNDYFTDIPDMDKSGFDFGDTTATTAAAATTAAGQSTAATGVTGSTGMTGSTAATTDVTKDVGNDLFDFDNLGAGGDPPDLSAGYFGGYDDFTKTGGYNGNATGVDASGLGGSTSSNNNREPGRIVETFTDSEATSPANTVDENVQQMNIPVTATATSTATSSGDSGAGAGTAAAAATANATAAAAGATAATAAAGNTGHSPKRRKKT
ncbi:hypothetical protein VTN77DRAFT_7051 [Rasamsonia byssochlamydoides]|uniref:uncharacterized protein n=1 Tax=Rasamsonia byssochlamydoides TaxID=89139 RepID=UPI0037429D2D